LTRGVKTSEPKLIAPFLHRILPRTGSSLNGTAFRVWVRTTQFVIPPVPACRGTGAYRSGATAVSFSPSDLTVPNKSHRPPLCHPDRSVAQWRDLLFLFCPSNLTAPNKSHNPPLVIPSVPGFPTSRLYQRQRMRLSVREPHVIPRSYSF
jgi:hypothetical protein